MGLFGKKKDGGLWASSRTPDYEHVIRETYSVYIGASMTYERLLAHEDVPFKFKDAVRNYILKETSSDTRIMDHLKKIDPGDAAALLYKQIRTRLTVTDLREDEKGRHKVETITFDEYMNAPVYTEHREDWFIQEIIISKLSLMTIG